MWGRPIERYNSLYLKSHGLWPAPFSYCLFAGREFFVGISKWTNHRGAEMVADAFRVSWNCCLIALGSGPILKFVSAEINASVFQTFLNLFSVLTLLRRNPCVSVIAEKFG